jgi:hypothetical protein
MYRIEDIEKINKNIDKIKDDAAKEYKTLYEPTLNEISKIYTSIKDYIKRKGRVAYGGFAQNLLIMKNNPDDSFYKIIDGVFYNWPDLADIEFYTSTPIEDVIELTEDLDDRELYWLNEYGGLNSNNTYNFKDPKTKEWSEYTKVKQSKSMLGENNPNYGNKWSEEQKEKLSKMKKGKTLEDRIGKERAELAKQKMSKSQKGRKHPEEVKEKIRQANIGENNPAYGKGDRQRGENNPNYNKPMPNRKRSHCQLRKVVRPAT